MSLTPKQEKFAQGVADGKSQTDAYRAAFNVRPTTKPETVQVSASKMMADPKVTQRVKELQNMLTIKALWTREDSVSKLQEALKIAEKTTDVVAVVKELNAMHGYNAPAKVEISGGLELRRIERTIIDSNDPANTNT